MSVPLILVVDNNPRKHDASAHTLQQYGFDVINVTTDEEAVRRALSDQPDLSADEHEAAIVVKDSGIGIAPAVLPHIFERFRQGEGGTTREFGGLGLGLAIVRHLVEAHGGHVRADSAGTGLGAEFTVSIPRLLD